MSTVHPPLRPVGDGEKGISLIRVAQARGGLRKGSKAVAFATAWAIAQSQVGHELGEGVGLEAALLEYSAWWKQSRATTYRELAVWREVFPEETTPARLVAVAQEHRESRRQTAAGGLATLMIAGS